MKYGRFNLIRELKKAARGEKTKLPLGLLVYLAVDGYPAAQARIAELFSIEEMEG